MSSLLCSLWVRCQNLRISQSSVQGAYGIDSLMSKLSELSVSPIHNNSPSMRPVQDAAAQQQRLMRESTIKLTELENKPLPKFSGDNLYQTNYETTWTISDQHRLLAMDRLQARTLEYHNNVHQRNADADTDCAAEEDDVVAQILFCKAKESERPFTATKAQFPSILTHIKDKSTPKGSTSWIHLFDLSELGGITDIFNMHPLCAASFRDLRCHSNIVQSANGFVVSLCYFQMNNSNFNVQMFKLYSYIAEGLIVTFIAELMPETEDAHTTSGTTGEEGADTDAMAANICSSVLEGWTKISRQCWEVGPVFLFYAIAMEALNQQDSLIEFFSRTLFYFKKKTSLSLSHRNKIAFMRRMHIVISAIQLILFNIQSISEIVDKLVLKAESSTALGVSAAASGGATAMRKGDSTMPLVSDALVGREQLPYLYDLQDLSDFLTHCLENEASEARVLTAAMDSITQLKANNTAMVLSLIATIFLPVTFLTGVFGMNFTVDGGFTIGLVNSPSGPLVFYMECVTVFVVIVAYYLSKGWIDVHSIRMYFARLLCGVTPKSLLDEDTDDLPAASSANKQPASVVTRRKVSQASAATALKIQLAVEEEARRVAETNRKRAKAQEITLAHSRSSTTRFSSIAGNSAHGPMSLKQHL